MTCPREILLIERMWEARGGSGYCKKNYGESLILGMSGWLCDTCQWQEQLIQLLRPALQIEILQEPLTNIYANQGPLNSQFQVHNIKKKGGGGGNQSMFSYYFNLLKGHPPKINLHKMATTKPAYRIVGPLERKVGGKFKKNK